jgi:hypothetical protein
MTRGDVSSKIFTLTLHWNDRQRDRQTDIDYKYRQTVKQTEINFKSPHFYEKNKTIEPINKPPFKDIT